jgi:hypothetical protein
MRSVRDKDAPRAREQFPSHLCGADCPDMDGATSPALADRHQKHVEIDSTSASRVSSAPDHANRTGETVLARHTLP